MTSTYHKKSKIVAILLAVLFSGLLPTTVAIAQSNALSLSVTPTLFEMAASPTQEWESSVKVINNNTTHLTVYASVVNFTPQGETGQGKLLPVFENFTDGTTLAEWIEITSDPIRLAPGASQAVPFKVKVPEDASPGGHFAAILVGTRPPSNSEAFKVQTSQIVTSLFFVRIAGDVVEDGRVREFRAVKSFVQQPDVDFEVRFENKGNVHIQPQGEILIKNMWGKERGVIPINHKTHFGNVLPESIRKFEFSWKGESSFSDIGRYSAELTLAYGAENRKFVTSKTSFWVIPIKPLLTVLGVLLFVVLFSLWAVKAYVRKMLALEGYQPVRHNNSFTREGDVLIQPQRRVTAPVEAGWFDLREQLKRTTAFIDTLRTLVQFIWQYKIFFGAVGTIVVVIIVVVLFAQSVLKDSRDYEIVIDNPSNPVTLSSEEIIYEQQAEAVSPTPRSVNETTLQASSSEQTFLLTIVNSSDTTGAAALMQRVVEGAYSVSELKSDFGPSKDRSVIVYHKDLLDEALQLRELVGQFILSALPPESEERSITIYIGNDYQPQ